MYHKLIAILIAAAVFTQDISWAGGEYLNRTGRSETLQVQSRFCPVDAFTLHETLLRSYIQYIILSKPDFNAKVFEDRLNPVALYKDINIVVDFSPADPVPGKTAGKYEEGAFLIVPCEISSPAGDGSVYKWIYEAVFSDEGRSFIGIRKPGQRSVPGKNNKALKDADIVKSVLVDKPVIAENAESEDDPSLSSGKTEPQNSYMIPFYIGTFMLKAVIFTAAFYLLYVYFWAIDKGSVSGAHTRLLMAKRIRDDIERTKKLITRVNTLMRYGRRDLRIARAVQRSILADWEGRHGLPLLPADNNGDFGDMDHDDLPYPDGVNVGVFPNELSGIQLAGILADQGKIQGVNIIFLFPEHSLRQGKRHPENIYASFGTIIKNGRVGFARFKRGIRIHAFFHGGKDKDSVSYRYFQKNGIPVVNPMEIDVICRDKIKTKQFFTETGIITPRYYVSDRNKDAYTQMRNFIIKNNISRIVIKPSGLSQGIGVKMFNADNFKEAVDHVMKLYSQGRAVIVEERVDGQEWIDSLGRKFDWNLRVLATWDGDEVIVNTDMIEARVGSYNGTAVNKSKGAQVLLMREFLNRIGIKGVARNDFIRQIESQIREAMKKLRDYTGQTPGLIGWDIMIEEEGGFNKWKVYFIEANSGNVGGIDTLESMHFNDDLGITVSPVINYVRRIAGDYKKIRKDDAKDGPGKAVPCLNDPTLLLNSVVHFDGGSIRLAKEYYEKALALNPADSLVRYNLSHIYEIIGKLNISRRLMEEALELNPDSPSFLFHMAEIYHRYNEHEKALVLLEKALEIKPDHGLALLLAANIHFLKMNYERTMEYINKIIRLGIMPTAVYLLKGDTLLKLGRYKEAIPEYKKALVLEPGSVFAITKMRYIYEKLGDKETALKYKEHADDLVVKEVKRGYKKDLVKRTDKKRLYEVLMTALPVFLFVFLYPVTGYKAAMIVFSAAVTPLIMGYFFNEKRISFLKTELSSNNNFEVGYAIVGMNDDWPGIGNGAPIEDPDQGYMLNNIIEKINSGVLVASALEKAAEDIKKIIKSLDADVNVDINFDDLKAVIQNNAIHIPDVHYQFSGENTDRVMFMQAAMGMSQFNDNVLRSLLSDESGYPVIGDALMSCKDRVKFSVTENNGLKFIISVSRSNGGPELKPYEFEVDYHNTNALLAALAVTNALLRCEYYRMMKKHIGETKIIPSNISGLTEDEKEDAVHLVREANEYEGTSAIGPIYDIIKKYVYKNNKILTWLMNDIDPLDIPGGKLRACFMGAILRFLPEGGKINLLTGWVRQVAPRIKGNDIIRAVFIENTLDKLRLEILHGHLDISKEKVIDFLDALREEAEYQNTKWGTHEYDYSLFKGSVLQLTETLKGKLSEAGYSEDPSAVAVRIGRIEELLGAHLKPAAIRSEKKELFFRNISEPEEAVRNLRESVLSVSPTKKLLLAFHKNIGCFEKERLTILMRKLMKLREQEEFRSLLANLEIIETFDDSAALSRERLKEDKGIDLNDAENNIVFAFLPDTESEWMEGLDPSIKSIHIKGNIELNAETHYYPLLEMITITLASYINAENGGDISGKDITDALLKAGTDPGELNIGLIETGGEKAFLIFTLVPNAGRYDTDGKRDRYALLLRAIKTMA